MQWMDCLMGEMDDRWTLAMDAEETRRIAGALHAEKKIGHPFAEIEAAWNRAKKENKPIPSKYYFDIYKLRFHANPRQGYNYLEKIMEHCDPSLGYHTLAKLLTENNLHNLVITTNFDSLVEDALFLYTDKKPLVVSHESLADYMEANIQRPIVAKVHRGLMYNPFNSPETTQELKSEWQDALSLALNTYTPIVIGYAGGDHSLMSFLEKETTVLRNGVYWCFRGKCDLSDLPEQNIQKFVENRNGFFVAIDGFDALMVEIGKTMYNDAIRPGLTEETLRKKHEDRVRRYNEQWIELNKKPEFQDTLQEMNEAEQQETEEREKTKSLTAQDYFRRGYDLSKKGLEEEAIKAYTKAIELDPNFAAAYNNRGILYDDLGKQQEALYDYNIALFLDSDYAFAYNNRAVLYQNMGESQKALDDYNKAIALDPDYICSYDNRGLLYYKLKDFEKAIKDHTQAIQLDPKYKDAYINRADAYEALGKKDLAQADRDAAEKL